MIEIKPANLRDASWITANLRAADREEVFCQLPDDTSTAALAHWLLSTGQGFIAYEAGKPVTLFGTSPITVCCMSVWAMGTERLPRTVDAISRFFIEQHIPDRLAQGFNSMEARSLATHEQAHRWMESMGGEKHGTAYVFGKNGEYFVTYRWTVAGYRTISRSRWSSEHVHSRQPPGGTSGAAGRTGTDP